MFEYIDITACGVLISYPYWFWWSGYKSQANKMSELDRDNAKTLDDEDTDSIEEIDNDTDEHVLVAEPTDRTTFQADLRAFFQLFNVVWEQLTLKI